MKRNLDEYLLKQMNENNSYVICADVGYFPNSRKHNKFIDVGNYESGVGAICEGLLSTGVNVIVYDICGYVLKNSYSSFFARNNTYYSNKGILTFIDWGSGFAYNGCLLGHYPLDDVMLAHMCGFNVERPYDDSFLQKEYTKDTYIKIFNLNEYQYYKQVEKYDTVFVSDGWMLCYLSEYVKNNNISANVIPYNLYNEDDYKQSFYFTDQICDIIDSNKFDNVFYSKNPNNYNVTLEYADKDSCLKSWIDDNLKNILTV